jgi:hypothetical protein
MKIAYALAIAAALTLAITLTVWSSGGFHRGWTQTQIPTAQVDPITEIEFVTYEEGFVAGLDFLLLGVGIAGALLVSSMMLTLRSRRKLQRTNRSVEHSGINS